MIPVAAPPRVSERLRGTPDGTIPVVHRGPSALYVDVGGWCIGVVTTGAAQVPCALRVPAGSALPADPATARVEGGTLHLGGDPLSVGRLVAVDVPPLAHGKAADPDAGPSDAVARVVAERLPRDRVVADVVPDLLGRGEGLTPLFDDVLAGWLAMHRAAGIATPEVDAAIRGHSDRTTLLSATLLDCAMHGEVLPEYAAWVTALGTPDEAARVRALHRVGATSGAGLHLGGRIALDQIREAA